MPARSVQLTGAKKTLTLPPTGGTMAARNATAAVVGAGDFIGAAIAKKFAAEGFTIFAGRRNADKLTPLVGDIEAAGGRVVARGLDARKEEDITDFLRAADAHAPLEVCIFFTGATASMRGGIGYAAFASAKSGLRSVAQSMARELGPKNIHVAHLVIDAGVDTAFVRERIRKQSGAEALERLDPDQLMNP